MLRQILENYSYPVALAVISVLVALAERRWPWRPAQRPLRARLPSDLVYLVFNGHFLGVLLHDWAARVVLPGIDRALRPLGVSVGLLDLRLAAEWPVPLQIVTALVVMDFMQWCVHNLLHRVPWLWELHKTHHSVVDGEMDWIVAFRFQWLEVVVYKALQYVPLALLGFGGTAVMVHAVFGTLVGHLNHANLNWDYGPLRYVFNSPRMHIWHHDYDAEGRTTVNFGIIFSAWDWMFGTARMPREPPRALGFAGVEVFPRNFFTQSLWPLPRLLRRGPLADAVFTALAVGLFMAAWWWRRG